MKRLQGVQKMAHIEGAARERYPIVGAEASFDATEEARRENDAMTIFKVCYFIHGRCCRP